MKLKIKDFTQHKKLWIGLIGALIIALGGWYYFWVYRPAQQKALADQQYKEMISFDVKDDKLPQETRDKYFKTFDESQKFFSTHQNDIAAYDALLKMGLIKQLIGDYHGAEQIFMYAYKLEPNSYILNGNIAHLNLYYLKNYAKAEEFYQKAIATAKGGNLYTYYTEMYDLYHDGLKDPAKTKALLTKAITVIPDSTQLLRLAGEYYKSIGDKEKARSYYLQALKIDPKDKVSQQELENL